MGENRGGQGQSLRILWQKHAFEAYFEKQFRALHPESFCAWKVATRKVLGFCASAYKAGVFLFPVSIKELIVSEADPNSLLVFHIILVLSTEFIQPLLTIIE